MSLARISHHLTVEERDRPAITSLRLLAVLNVLSLQALVEATSTLTAHPSIKSFYGQNSGG